jgi:hypothetical protein
MECAKAGVVQAAFHTLAYEQGCYITGAIVDSNKGGSGNVIWSHPGTALSKWLKQIVATSFPPLDCRLATGNRLDTGLFRDLGICHSTFGAGRTFLP